MNGEPQTSNRTWCLNCHGTGKVRSITLTPRPTGPPTTQAKMVPCPECQGRGHHPQETTP